MERYVFSGNLTEEMAVRLLNHPKFEPLSILTTQVDRGGVKQSIEYKKRGICDWFFLDSGAFSVHTGNATTTLDEYIEYVNSIDEYIDVCAQLDTIPGKFGQPKTPEDYRESAEKSWRDFLYMRDHVKSPHKVMPVFHAGENFDALDRMLNWKDENGNPLDYVGISPANDQGVQMRDQYLKEVYDHIAKSINPKVKTHLYGYTSLQGLAKFPCYSADSISHRLISAYNKLLTLNFGVISLSKQSRTVKSKSNMSFVETADEATLKKLNEEIESFGFDLDTLRDSNAERVVYNILVIQKLIKTKYKYNPKNLVRSKKLF